MKIQISDLWRWDGAVDRGPYALIGLLGFAIKHNIDRFVATLVFNRKWSLFNYWIPPTAAVHITSLPKNDAVLLATMLAVALPFIWSGVVLTLRRLFTHQGQVRGYKRPFVIRDIGRVRLPCHTRSSGALAKVHDTL